MAYTHGQLSITFFKHSKNRNKWGNYKNHYKECFCLFCFKISELVCWENTIIYRCKLFWINIKCIIYVQNNTLLFSNSLFHSARDTTKSKNHFKFIFYWIYYWLITFTQSQICFLQKWMEKLHHSNGIKTKLTEHKN